MPGKVQDLKIENINQSWKEAFEQAEKTTDQYQNLIEIFADFAQRYYGFSDARTERLIDYLKNLDDVKDHWEDINTWIDQNAESLQSFTGSLSDISQLFHDIASETGGLRRQLNDKLNIVRKISSLAEEAALATKQEGGLTDNLISRLSKKSTRYVQDYQIRLRALGVEKDIRDLSTEDIPDLTNRRESIEQLQSLAQRELATLTRKLSVKDRATRLEGMERANAIARVGQLRDEIKLHQINLELLSEYNLQAIKGLQEQIDKQEEYYRQQRKGLGEGGRDRNAVRADKVQVATKLLKKFGLGETANEFNRTYGEFLGRRVGAFLETDQARKEKEQADQRVSNLLADKEKSPFASRVQKVYTTLEQVQDIKAAKVKQLSGFGFDPDKVEWETGRVRRKSGQFVSEEEVARAKKLKNEIGDLDQQIRDCQEGIERFKTKDAELANEVLGALGSQKTATDKLEEASRNENDILNTKFNLISQIKDSLKSTLSPAKLLGGLLSAIAGILVSAALKVDELGAKLRQRTGTWEISMAAVNSQFASATDWLEVAVDLADSFNIAPQTIFTPTEIGKMAEAKNLLGLSAEQARNLGVYAKIAGQTSDDLRKNINKGFQEYNRVNRTAINYGNVQKEILNTSDALRLSIGGNGEALGKAANAALELGMHMQDVENIASNLINFESSIQAEMQAQLLTGKQLNLAKAREFALNNDIAGVAGEIKKQGIDAAWWGGANRIQQENIAKALGMSREQMAKMLVQQELQNGASAEMLARNMKITAEEVKAMGMANTWKKSIEQLAQSLVPIIELIRPVVELVGVLVSKISSVIGWVLSLGGLLDRLNEKTSKWIQTLGKVVLAWPLLGRVVGRFFTGFAGGIGSSIAGVGKLSASIMMLFTTAGRKELGERIKRNTVGKIKEGINAAKGSGKVGNLGNTVTTSAKAQEAAAGSAATGAAGKTAQTVKGKGSNLPKLGRGIAGFLKAFTPVKPADIGKATLAALAFIPIAAMTPFIALASVTGPLAAKGLPALGRGIAGFFKAFKNGASIVQGAAMLSATMIAATPAIIIFTGAAIGLAVALRLLAPAIEAFSTVIVALGTTIKSAFEGVASIITATFGGITNLLSVITLEKAAALVALGGSFVALAGGLVTATAAIVAFPVRRFGRILNMVPEKPTTGIEVQEKTEEKQGIQQGNIEASVQSITIKQAEVQASAQKLTIEQKSADLSRIEQKMDAVIKAVKDAAPTGWDWVRFGQEFGKSVPFANR